MNSATHPRSLRILSLGALLGAILGALDATDWMTSNQQLSESSIAAVNSTQIRLLEYQRALNMLASEKRDPITDQDRDLVLQRLIDEELLIQQGLNSDLIRTNIAVRNVVLQSILAGIMVEIEASNSQEQVLADYIENLKTSANIEWSAAWEQP
jgi:hypothetical protein